MAKETADDDLHSVEDDAVPDDALPFLDTLLIRKDMNDCIRGIVDGLPENYRTVTLLSELEGFTNAEIAEVLGIAGRGKDQAAPREDQTEKGTGKNVISTAMSAMNWPATGRALL